MVVPLQPLAEAPVGAPKALPVELALLASISSHHGTRQLRLKLRMTQKARALTRAMIGDQ